MKRLHTVVLFSSLLVFSLYIVTVPVASAATAKCHSSSILLTGSRVQYGVRYSEKLYVHKASSGKGFAGRWKIDRYVQTITYPSRIPVAFNQTNVIKLGRGLVMKCNGRIMGNVIQSTCTGNLSFVVSGNKIRFDRTGTYNGFIKGNSMSFKFGMKNPLEPMKTGTMQKGPDKPMTLTIGAIPAAKYKFKFSNQSRGKLQFEMKASVSPQKHVSDVVWRLPKIRGSKRTIIPASARGERVKVIYTDLPRYNSEFGKKKVTAELRVGSCIAKESYKVQFYYDLLARNNPGKKYPNWFYYWKQTPAARPGGQKPVILYGGRTFKHCRFTSVPAQYTPNYAYKGIHVCDLSKLGPTFESTFPVIDRNAFFRKWSGMRTTKFIDTFATAVIHEYKHFQHYHAWRYGKSASKIRSEDKDNDGIPDHLEPGMKFDPNKVQTYYPVKLSKIAYDEEWLAYEAMRHHKIGSFNQYDWAAPGSQW